MFSPFVQKFNGIIQDRVPKSNTKKVEILYRAAGVVYADAAHDNYIEPGIEPGIFPCQKCFGRTPQTHGLCWRNRIPTGDDGWAAFNLYENDGFTAAGNNVNLGTASIAAGDISRPQNSVPMYAQIHTRPKFGK